ncbi:MAG: hypothetical protein Fur003_2660 [Candidatus Dojkabacteria bacterium]
MMKAQVTASFQKIKALLTKYSGYAFVCWKGVCTTSGDSFSSIGGVVSKASEVYKFGVNVSALVAGIVLVYGAYTYITSAGDDQKADMASKLITNSIIGLVIIFVTRIALDFVLDNL